MVVRTAARAFSVLCLAVGATGCVSGDPEVATFEPTLENIQAQVFAPACATSGCHSASQRAGNIDLSSADASYEALVGVPATNSLAQENRWLRVKPGDPDLSFLCRKMDLPGMGEGAAMPPGDMAVDAEHVALIEDWIANGAER